MTYEQRRQDLRTKAHKARKACAARRFEARNGGKFGAMITKVCAFFFPV
jgi:hypothetical protein